MLKYTSVIVLGGGPAGGAIALELARSGREVVLLESQSKTGWKIGETLPPEARVHLQRLGHWERFQLEHHLPCHGVVSTWGNSVPVEKDYIFNPHGHGWQLDRSRFETGLLSAAVEAGCKVIFDTSVGYIARHAAGWSLETSKGPYGADYVVDCTGRRGCLIRQEGGCYEQLDRQIAVFCIAITTARTDADSRTFVESQPNGWVYTALMPNGARTISLQTDSDLMPEGEPTADWFWGQLRDCPRIHTLLTSHSYQLIGNPRSIAAHSGRYQRSAGPDWIAVGDSAMTFDPLSGQGAAKALVSAGLAAKAILTQGDYQEECDRLWAEFVNTRRVFYQAEERWKTRPFWERRFNT